MVTGKSLLVHVGGARGVGKSAVLDCMHKTVITDLPFVIIPVSAFVLQLGKEMYNRDWGELVSQEREKIRNIFVEHLKQFSLGIIVLDSHYIDVLPNGTIRPIVPHELYPLIQCHVVIDCDSDALLLRRRNDPLKKRSLNKQHIERERHGEVMVAQKISQETRTPFHVVFNEQNTEYAALQLGDIIKTLWQISASSPQTPPK